LEAPLFNPDPVAYLPHRPPFLFLDRILALEPGVSALARQLATGDVAGYSRFFMVEAIAQLGGIAAARDEGGGGILAAIDQAEFHGAIAAGDMVTIGVRIVKSFGQLHLVEGEVSVDGRKLATATVTLKVGIMP
jgi:3-hydroxyacyl-[acyl-carrier-protein] dehydratase